MTNSKKRRLPEPKQPSKAGRLETELKGIYEELGFDPPNKLMAREVRLYHHLTSSPTTINEEILLSRITDLENETKLLRAQKVNDALADKLERDQLVNQFFFRWVGNHRHFLALFLSTIFVGGAILGVQIEKSLNGSRNSITPIEALTK